MSVKRKPLTRAQMIRLRWGEIVGWRGTEENLTVAGTPFFSARGIEVACITESGERRCFEHLELERLPEP